MEQKIKAKIENPKKLEHEDSYSLRKAFMIKIEEREEKKESNYQYDTFTKRYEKKENLETNKAIIICAGQIQYDAKLGNDSKFGEIYNFRPYFKLMRKCLKKADLSIGTVDAMFCDYYLSTEMMQQEYNPNPYYNNARKEYLDAFKYAGFDCIAMANPNNLDTGVEGILRTVENINNYAMLSVGIGKQKNKIFKINGIHVAVLSYTFDCYEVHKFITEEGKDKLLNIYSKEKAQTDMIQLKEDGADFILIYVNCGSAQEQLTLKERKK